MRLHYSVGIYFQEGELRPEHEDENQIYIVRSGRVIMLIEDEEQEVGPGWVVHIPTGKLYSLEPLDCASVVVYSIKHKLRPDFGA